MSVKARLIAPVDDQMLRALAQRLSTLCDAVDNLKSAEKHLERLEAAGASEGAVRLRGEEVVRATSLVTETIRLARELLQTVPSQH